MVNFKKLLISAALMISVTSHAANISTIPTVTIGPRVFTDLTSNLITLYCPGTTAGNYTTCRKAGGSAGYQVTAGKTMTVYAGKFCNTAGSSGTYQSWNILYGTSDIGLNSSASAPAGVVRQYGGAAGAKTYSAVSSSNGESCAYGTVDMAVPAADYIAIQVNGTTDSMTTLYAIEN